LKSASHINLVSIIIPAYNAERFIAETIDSVISQDYPDWELLIVNDGSTDSTKSIIDTYAKRDERITTIHKTNSGVSDSRNTGIKHAKGDYIFFLDADDVWNPNNVSEKVNYLNKEKVDAVYSSCELINESSIPMNSFLKGAANVTLSDILSSKGNYTTAPSGIVVTKQVLEKIKGFDVHLSNNADTDFFISILAAKFKIGFITTALWKYRIHEGNMSKNVKLLEKDILYVLHKAKKNNLYESFWFKQRCFSHIYLVLAASWLKNGKNIFRFFYYITLALITYPPSIFIYLSRK